VLAGRDGDEDEAVGSGGGCRWKDGMKNSSAPLRVRQLSNGQWLVTECSDVENARGSREFVV
jgi:hypothetical protein